MPFDETTPLVPLEDLLNEVVAAAAARLQTGTASSGTLESGTSTPVSITFSPAFSAPPTVIPQLRGTPVSGNRAVSIGSVTATGASINVINNAGTGAVTFDWIAVGP